MDRPEQLIIETTPDDDRLVVAASGELDLATVGTLRVALDEALAAGWAEVVVDLRGLDFMDGQGASALMSAHARAVELGRRLSYVDGASAVSRVTDILGDTWTVAPARRDVPDAGAPG